MLKGEGSMRKVYISQFASTIKGDLSHYKMTLLCKMDVENGIELIMLVMLLAPLSYYVEESKGDFPTNVKRKTNEEKIY